MADTQQIIIELIADTSQLQPGVDKLEAIGKIDQASAAIFRQTNEQIKQRNSLLDKTVQASEQVNQEASEQQVIYNKLAASVQKLSGASKDAVQNLLKMSPKEIAAGFQQAAVDVDDYIAALEGAGQANDELNQKTQTIRQELKELTNQLSQLALDGKAGTEEFEAMALRAGKLRNALDDTRQTIGNLGQDVPIIQVFGSALQGITGGFTAAVGAQALFGEENKDLQTVLVRVNSVMAVNAGLTQLITTLKDEALVSTTKAIAAQTVENAQIAINNGLQSESVVVRGAATVAQYALNLAMSLSPLGLVTIALAAFVAGIAIYVSNAQEAAKAQAELNAVLNETGDILDAGLEATKRSNDRLVADLQNRNARESEVQQQGLRALKSANQQRLDAIAELNDKIEKNQNSTDSDMRDLVKKALEQRYKLEKDAADGRTEIYVKEDELRKQQTVEQLEDQANAIQARLILAKKNSDQEFALERQLAVAKSAIDIQAAGDDAEKIKAIRAQLARDITNIDIAQAKVREDALEASLQSELIKAQNQSRAINDRTSQDEIDAQIKIIKAKADFEVAQEGLSRQQIKAIRDKADQDALELQRNFSRQEALFAIQDQISANNAVLSNIKLSEKEKLDLREQNIILAASAEIEQNQGKVQKIKEIEAKRDADIKAARLQSIEETLQRELALQEAQEGAAVRNIERQLAAQDQINNAQGLNGDKIVQQQLNAQKLSVDQQIALIDRLTNHNLQNIQKERDATDEEFAQRLISQEDYSLKSAILDDKEAQAKESSEQRKRDAINRTAALAKQRQEEIIKLAIQAASDAVGVLSSLYQQDAQAAQDRIAAQRQAIQDLSDAGAISAKEATARNKKLDVEQKQLQIQQAKRQKELDLFQAILNTALAVTNALTSGDPYTAPIRAAIAGALGTAQIAVIASRPIPQFGKGKKGNYQGWAEVGETGPEFVRRNGRLYLEDKPTITWLDAADKVYNPKETAAMIEARVPTNWYPGISAASPTAEKFDYDRMGRAVGENIPQYGIGFDEHGIYQWQQSKQSFTKYLNQRRSWVSR